MKLMGLISELAIIRGKIHTMKDNPPFKTNEEVKVKRQSGRGMYWTNYDEGNLRLQVTKYGSKYEANFYKLGGSSQPSWKLELKDLSKNDATALGKLVKSKGVKASAKVAKSKYKKHISEGKKVKIDTIKNNIKLVLDVEIEAQNIINALKADKKKLTLNNISNYINAEYKFFKTPSLNHQVFKHIKKNLKKLSEGKLNEKKKKYIKDLSPEEFKVYRKAAMLKSYGKITQQKFDSVVKKLVGEGKLNEKAKRNYKEEYKKYGSSKKAKKYRAELNKYNRQKGTYGNGDGLDASHMNGKIVGFEEQSINRGRAEKSRLKKEGKLTEKVQKYVVASEGGHLYSGDKAVTEKQALKIMDRFEKVGMNLFMLGVQYWNKPHKANKKKIMVKEGKLNEFNKAHFLNLIQQELDSKKGQLAYAEDNIRASSTPRWERKEWLNVAKDLKKEIKILKVRVKKVSKMEEGGEGSGRKPDISQQMSDREKKKHISKKDKGTLGKLSKLMKHANEGKLMEANIDKKVNTKEVVKRMLKNFKGQYAWVGKAWAKELIRKYPKGISQTNFIIDAENLKNNFGGQGIDKIFKGLSEGKLNEAKETIFDVAHRVLKNKSMEKYKSSRGQVMVDVQSANLLVKVFKKVNSKMKNILSDLGHKNPAQLMQTLWAVVK